MAETTTILLVRHGETDWNKEHRLQGHTDIPINEHGEKQAQAAGEGLKDKKIDVCVSSDLARAHRTAEVICRAVPHLSSLGPDAILKEPGLRERHLGVFQGQVKTELPTLFPDAHSRYLVEADYAIPDGESQAEFHARVTAALEGIAAAHRGKTVLVVTHGGALAAILKHLLGLPLSAPRSWAITNAAISEVRHSGDSGWLVQQWNNTSHLQRLGFILI